MLDAIALGALVLIQQGKGADVGAAFGSGSANTLFGSRGSASFLTKTTVWLSIAFFGISFGLAYTAKERAALAGSIGLPGIEAPLELPADTPDAPESTGVPENTGLADDTGVPGDLDAPSDSDAASESGGPDEASDTQLPDV